MKVIAKASESEYLCTVSHSEIEKFMGKYYGDMTRLQVGQEVNLGLGHDFSGRIEQACKSMAQAMKDFESARSVMTAFAVAIAKATGEHHDN